MAVYDAPSFDNHENVIFCHDIKTGVKAIIAIHNTNLGPALGGCRMWPYATSSEALDDVLRLSRGMTYKSAMANLPLGGGKMVTIGDPASDKNPDLLRKLGDFVESLNGQYITAEDMGMTMEDIRIVQERTPHVVGIPDGHGDPSPFTAYGVYQGMLSAARYKLGVSSLKGLRVVVQGLGAVGYKLCKHLKDEGAIIYAYDPKASILESAASEYGVKPIGPSDVLKMEADIYAPCARGGTLNPETIPELRVSLVCGGANNQLKTAADGIALMERDILYTPDYVVNQGGLVCVWNETNNKPVSSIYDHLHLMDQTLNEIFSRAEELNISTSEASDQIAESRFMKKAKD